MALGKRLINTGEKPIVNTSNFNTVLWDMNGIDGRYISNVGFQPDFVWIKDREDTSVHVLFDSIRGATNYLSSSSTAAEASASTTLKSFEANGFTLGNSGAVNDSSGNGAVAWCWKGSNADAVSNTDGSITSQVSANTDAGFSIVKWTDSALIADTVGHGLSFAPELILYKNTSDSRNWNVYSASVGSSKNMHLNLSDSANTSEYWSVNSTTFAIQDQSASADRIAYCFHSVPGYSKIGGFVGDGSTDTVLNLGFEPKWIMIKNANTTTGWFIMDFPRDNFAQRLRAEVNNIESSIGTLTTSSTGITISSTASDGRINGRPSQSDTMLYMAFK